MKFMKLKKAHGLFLISLTLLTLSACTEGATTTEAALERVIAVNTAYVGTGSIRSELSFAGQVRAAEHIAVMSRVPGMVDEVFVNTGDFVNAGDVLFTMDAVDLRNNINSLEAQLGTAEAAVNAARTGVTQAGGSAMQQQILQATGGLAQAETSLEQAALALSQAQNAYNNARQSYTDTTALFAGGVATRMQMDQAETGLTNARIGLEQATNSHNLASLALSQAETSHQLVAGDMPAENLRRAQDGLAQAIAQRDSLLVNLDAARERIDDAAVRSPISGTIGSRNIEPRTMLAQGMAPFTVVSTDTVTVSVEVTEVIINSIQAGQAVSVNITAASALPFTGEVITVSPAADLMTSTFTVEVSVDNRAGTIRPGMFAEVFFVRHFSDNAVIVPRSAVIVEDGDTVVYIAHGASALRRPVVTGIDNGIEIEIISGLAVGEPLIVVGQTFVTDGVPILIVESVAESGGGLQ